MDTCADIEAAAGALPQQPAAPALAAPRTNRRPRQARRVPDSITNDPQLAVAMAALPANYNFEIPKTIWKIQELVREAAVGMPKVALQFPEGLLMYSCAIADILERFAGCECVVLGDVTYGACCIDDLTAKSLGCDMMVHYGHSCLVPVSATVIRCLYVFVEIAIDVDHLCECVKKTFAAGTEVALMGTIQFASAVHEARTRLAEHLPGTSVPQAKPLSPGEVLGCTSPAIDGKTALVFVADGRFHLESAMIQNPHMEHLRYDPYSKVLSREGYDTDKMRALRRAAIDRARGATAFGVILGTLGRQGNPHILDRLLSILTKHGKRHFVMLLSEIFPAKLAAVRGVDAWIQVACPRLSIDWGHFFDKPLLSPYEAEVCLGETDWRAVYPMDFYAKSGGSWSNGFTAR
ncbi:diphthamide biosynthesis protein 1 [Tribonema minus]|uniref:2-(3-amino-3-carboxypropyl)histidine synthase subunit 1 n=1 Tax=Tribonema minus TaxID=303371 RepID=A0A835ZHS6_9STRA|nr:diphthamide biosynthesis protein 1 [Tribonema minus]